MNETLLRWKARIGALKPLALVVLIFVVIFLVIVTENIFRSLNNRGGSEAVQIHQLVANQIGANKFVTVSGIAVYKLGYQETEDGSLKAIIYPLIDGNTNDVIFVRTTHTELADATEVMVKISGLTQSASTDLRQLIEKDMPDITSAGLTTVSNLYIEEGRQPGNLVVYLLEEAVLGLLLLVCAVSFFFPSTVFNPYPLQAIPSGADTRSRVRASGVFRQLTKTQPTLEFGKGRRQFQNANANLFTLEDKYIGVFIHFIFIQRVYGIQVSKRETDWAMIIKPDQVLALEPGKLYGWRDQWAVSFRYRIDQEKQQRLILAFDHSAGQASFVNYLREKGYPVSSGQYTVTGPQWA